MQIQINRILSSFLIAITVFTNNLAFMETLAKEPQKEGKIEKLQQLRTELVNKDLKD